MDRLAVIQERMRVGERRRTEINRELLALEDEAVGEEAAVGEGMR